MSLLDALNNKKAAGLGKTFTEQAEQMKTALSGKATEGVAVQKSNVAEQVATAQGVEQEQKALSEAQTVQQKADLESAQIAQQSQLTALDYKQKESDLVSQAQRQFDSIYTKLSENYLDLDANQKAATLDQLEFLHNLTDRQYVDRMQVEGDRRRLDDTMQMKSAVMYATFEDQIDQLNSDLDFKKALAADDRTFNEFLMKIEPQAAIEASLIKYKSEQSAAATVGMAEGVASSAGKLASNYDWSSSSKSTESAPIQQKTVATSSETGTRGYTDISQFNKTA